MKSANAELKQGIDEGRVTARFWSFVVQGNKATHISTQRAWDFSSGKIPLPKWAGTEIDIITVITFREKKKTLHVSETYVDPHLQVLPSGMVAETNEERRERQRGMLSGKNTVVSGGRTFYHRGMNMTSEQRREYNIIEPRYGLEVSLAAIEQIEKAIGLPLPVAQRQPPKLRAV